MEFPRQEYSSGLPFPPPGDLPDLMPENLFEQKKAQLLLNDEEMLFE